ncbi:MAG: TRAP transporter large permease subunit [Candidatus Eisenbacteria bacterium]|uniref:TRAP transporter large permease subunit n=1 Tax=Eiseniibacteriota bacterium TaxID=2212470 RepID=A0A849SFT3_UNCEI|nr:TRAP transporter large permease subunit [Candidatus Eisenbacteria bacterium]
MVASVALALMAVLPIAEMVARKLFHTGLPGSESFVRHLTLWVGFMGAAIAASRGELLALATGTMIPDGRWRRAAGIFAAAIGACVATLLARASFDMVVVERESAGVIALGVPVWIGQLVLPISFGLIALRLAWRASPGWVGRSIAGLGIVVGLIVAQYPTLLENRTPWPFAALVIVGTLLGGPLFALLGGVALAFFLKDAVPIAAVPVETYRLAVSPTLAAIPLFTLTGFFLSEGRASQRLLRVFRALLGWLPGGTAIVTAAVCAFFTAFTGGSGITILALGAILLQALKQEGYRDEFSLGLITACGSLGLLFPPSLPVILYGVVAQIPIENLFLGGLLPGFLLLAMVAVYGIREGIKQKVPRQRFAFGELFASMNGAKWELLLPVVVLIAVFGGFATIVEASALTVLYTFVTQCFVQRDLSATRDVPRVLGHSVVLVGGVLVILGAAMGLSSYMVDAEVPARLVEWTQSHVHSPAVFLLGLNVFLLIVGCLMDVFSAIVVVVPLIVPIGMAFGIHPVHLAIIFIANLELGYLTPPVGLNLFLASYRFQRPMMAVTRASLPMLLILLVGVLLITYLPWLTTVLVSGR